MNIDQEFPKRYITSADVDNAGGPVRLRITDVVVETIGSGPRVQRKPAVCFHGTRKVLALNAANLNFLKSHLGPETAHWVGSVVTLGCVDDKFEGRAVRSVRIMVVVPASLPDRDLAFRPSSSAAVVSDSSAASAPVNGEIHPSFSIDSAGRGGDGFSNGSRGGF